jgi:hypothetical protein
MTSLDRVPAPRSPLQGPAGWVVGSVVLGLVLAVVKPWGDGDLRPTYSPPTAVRGDASVAPGDVAHYDGAAYGSTPPPAAWAIVTPDGAVDLPFLGRGEGAAGDGTGSTVDTVVSGPVVPIGRTAPVLSIALTHPPGSEVLAARLWSLEGPAPSRIELQDMPPPWPVDHVVVLARRGPAGGASVLPWAAGLYRLDLLIGPERVARSVMISVDRGGAIAAAPTASAASASDDAGEGAGGADPDDPAAPGEDPVDGFLDVLPDRVSLWTAGRVLAGWSRAPTAARCTVVELWGATGPRDPCWPVPIGDVIALGVSLQGRSVDEVALVRLDPLPGPVTSPSRTDVRDRAGLAFVQVPDSGLPDGIYRLDARIGAGRTLSWYVEVGPVGRAVARFEAASARR